MFCDEALARDIPAGLYVGHLHVDQWGAILEHDEHAPVRLPKGTYRVRRQRQVEPDELRLVED